MTLVNIDGIIGKSFQLGYGTNSFTLTVDADGYLNIKYNGEPLPEDPEASYVYPTRVKLFGGLDAGNGAVTSTHKPANDPDLINLKYLMEQLSAYLSSAKRYTDKAIEQISQGGESGGGTSSSSMIAPTRVNVEQLTDGYSAILGTLKENAFIDRVIFELRQPFFKLDGSDYDIAIGVITNQTALVGWTPISTLTETKVFDICKTLTTDAEYCIFVRTHEEEPVVEPFEQKLINNHEDVSSSMTSDASENIWHIHLNGTNLESEVFDTATFGEVSGPFMDFGVNIPVVPGHQYRIVQTNPALAYYDGKDEFISEVEGVWTKDKTYTFEESEVDLMVLLTESAGDSDFAHVYIYDLNGDTPDVACRVYHFQNGLHFTGSSPAVSPLQLSFLSASEGAVGAVQNATNQFTINLSGQITSKETEVAEKFPGITGHATSLSIFYPKTISTTGVRAVVYNPAASKLTEDNQTVSGISFTDVTYTPEQEQDGAWIEFPIIEDKSYPIVVCIIDLSTKDYMLIGVDNNLTFQDAANGDAGTDIQLQNTGYAVPAALDEVDLMAEGDTGSMIVRILSF